MNMNRIKLHCLQRQDTNPTDDDRRSSLPSTSSSSSSDSSKSSISSTILSVCELSINLNQHLVTNDNQSVTNTNEKRNSIENTSLCKICRKFSSLNQYGICLQCHEYQSVSRSNSLPLISSNQNSDGQIIRSKSFYVKNTHKKDGKLQTEEEYITHSVSLHREHQPSIDSLSKSSSASIQSCLHQLLLQPKFSIETNVIETKPCPLSVSVPLLLNLSPEHIDHCKHRRLELDRVVNKLLESLTIKGNENFNQISKYWSYLKQLSLDQFQPKRNNYQLFDYLLKSSYSNKQFETYLEENDEIKAALQVLSTVLTIVHEKYSFSTISQLFDAEEKTMLENLRHQTEFLRSSYMDELSFIHSRIHFYESCVDGEKNFDWIQSIKADYPILIEKICDDFVIKVPQIEQILVQMLRNMKKRLLNIDIGITKETN